MIYYILIILVIFICLGVYFQVDYLAKMNNKDEILQAEYYTLYKYPAIGYYLDEDDNEILMYDYDINKIQIVLFNRQPTIFRGVLFDWTPIAEIFDLTVEDILNIYEKNKYFKKDLCKYLNDYSLSFSYGWNISFINLINKDNGNTHFIKNKDNRYLIGVISGESNIYLCPPSKAIASKKNGINIEEVEFINNPSANIEHIQIILREGNLLYIPREWYYLISTNSNAILFSSVNKSILNWF